MSQPSIHSLALAFLWLFLGTCMSFILPSNNRVTAIPLLLFLLLSLFLKACGLVALPWRWL